jgi:hypothetical protein
MRVHLMTDYDPYADGECYCGGCVGMGPCDDDLGRTDDLDDDDCPDCGERDCTGDCDVSEWDDGQPWPLGTVTVTAFQEAGLL